MNMQLLFEQEGFSSFLIHLSLTLSFFLIVFLFSLCRPDILATCNIVVDVGAVYDPESFRFDHHQREFNGVLEGYSTKLSSAGLIYRHFGKDIIRSVFRQSGDFGK